MKRDISKYAISLVDEEVANLVPFGPICWIEKKNDHWELYSQDVSWHPWKERDYPPILHSVLNDEEANFLISLEDKGEAIIAENNHSHNTLLKFPYYKYVVREFFILRR